MVRATQGRGRARTARDPRRRVRWSARVVRADLRQRLLDEQAAGQRPRSRHHLPRRHRTARAALVARRQNGRRGQHRRRPGLHRLAREPWCGRRGRRARVVASHRVPGWAVTTYNGRRRAMPGRATRGKRRTSRCTHRSLWSARPARRCQRLRPVRIVREGRRTPPRALRALQLRRNPVTAIGSPRTPPTAAAAATIRSPSIGARRRQGSNPCWLERDRCPGLAAVRRPPDLSPFRGSR